MDDRYGTFLARAAAALGAAGAQPVLPAPVGQRAASWDDWDQFLLLDAPGSPAFYAFTHLNAHGARDVSRRIDQLAQDLASRLTAGQGALNVVHVVVAPEGLDERGAREITRLAPSRYHAGLRPSTVVVDLLRDRVYTSGILARPPGVDLLRDALRSRAPLDTMDVDQINALRQSYADRVAAFYRLMRGRQPLVTYGLVAINVLIFLIMYLNGAMTGDGATDAGLRDFGALSPRLIEQGQWWRLFTSMFLHAGVTHILVNMVSLVAIGTLAERLYGSVKFLAIYLGSGLVGALTSFGYAVALGHLDILGVGASGAIFGVAGALVTVRFHPSDVIPRQVRHRISSSIFPLVALNLIVAHFLPNVDNSAHIGGLIGGMVLSFVLPLTRSLSEVS